MKNEQLIKSADELIDQLFTEEAPEASEEKAQEETVEKAESQMDKLIDKEPKKVNSSLPLSGKSKQTADEGEQPPSPEDEKDGKNGRPKDLSTMDKRDAAGDAKGKYDGDITSPAKMPQHETTVAKAEGQPVQETVTLSKEEFEVLKKAADALLAQSKQEELKKAEVEKTDLIKSAVVEATKDIREELKKAGEQLKKTQTQNEELSKVVKSIGSRPRAQKSISSVQVLEKGFVDGSRSGSKPESNDPEFFSKSEMVDAAEELVHEGKLELEDAIELQSTGTLFNKSKRALVEQKLRQK